MRSSIAARALPNAAAPIDKREEPEHGEAIQRTVQVRAVEQREHAIGRYEGLVGNGVVAAGAAQAQRVPGVENLEIFFA